MKDRPDDPSHHERTLLPRSYISLLILWYYELFYLFQEHIGFMRFCTCWSKARRSIQNTGKTPVCWNESQWRTSRTGRHPEYYRPTPGRIQIWHQGWVGVVLKTIRMFCVPHGIILVLQIILKITVVYSGCGLREREREGGGGWRIEWDRICNNSSIGCQKKVFI